MDHTILVVDDEPASLRALRRVLSPHYDVVTAEGGSAALCALDVHPVSLIVSDHRMPELSGVEMLVRARASHPDAIRILLTGYADVEALVDAVNDGAIFYYLTKPWEPPDLLLAVRRGIERLETERQRRALLRDLDEACSRARREAEQKTRLLRTAAHELGTPVHLLGNALDLLGGISQVADSEWFAVAGRNLAWLQRSLAQMQTAFRLRSGDLHLAPAAMDLGAALKAVLHDVARAASARQLDFRSFVRGTLHVRADRRLDEVWINLLSNAVRFTPDGGKVAVVAAPQDDGVVVQVADTGIGMTAEQVAGAFEAFSNSAGDLLLHGSGRLEFGARGMGLGLSIAQSLVRLHAGRIRIESEVDRGTVVEVWLPACGGAAIPT